MIHIKYSNDKKTNTYAVIKKLPWSLVSGNTTSKAKVWCTKRFRWYDIRLKKMTYDKLIKYTLRRSLFVYKGLIKND
jgi:hypothetical protein